MNADSSDLAYWHAPLIVQPSQPAASDYMHCIAISTPLEEQCRGMQRYASVTTSSVRVLTGNTAKHGTA